MAIFTTEPGRMGFGYRRQRFQALIGLVLLAGLVVSRPALSAVESEPPGSEYWLGSFSYRGAEMSLRLRIQLAAKGSASTPAAWLDLPGLLMAWEPVPVSRQDQQLLIEFPFGIGEFAFDPQDRQIDVSRKLGDSEITLRLEPAAAPEFTVIPLMFQSAGVSLAGEIAMPPGPGPHPAIVLLHGSGTGSRKSWSYRSWADLLVRRGLAVLYYDKRGTGESGGDANAGLRQLADDGIAAVKALRQVPGIDPARVGIKGSSQGAWLAEQVAADLGDISFLLLVGAPAVTPRQQELQQLEYGMRDDGMPESDIEAALNYLGLYFYVARTGLGWPLLEQAIVQAQAADWGRYVDQPRSLDDLAWWKQNHDFQIRTGIGSLDLPVLLLYGTADWVVPPAENAAKLKSLFRSPEKAELHIFPFADHRLELPMGEDHLGTWQWPRMPPGMEAVVSSWLEKVLR